MKDREGLWHLLVTWGFIKQMNSTGPYRCDVKCGDVERGQPFVKVNSCVSNQQHSATHVTLMTVNHNRFLFLMPHADPTHFLHFWSSNLSIDVLIHCQHCERGPSALLDYKGIIHREI